MASLLHRAAITSMGRTRSVENNLARGTAGGLAGMSLHVLLR